VNGLLFIPVHRRVMSYIVFVGKYVTRIRKRFQFYEVYNIQFSSGSLADSIWPCPSGYLSVWTLRSRKL